MTDPNLSAPRAGAPGAAALVEPGDGQMRAIVQIKYGAPEDLALQNVDKPLVGENDVLVRVRASAVNAGDWRLMRGEPYLARMMMGGIRTSKIQIIGVDVSGEVETVGRSVTALKPGDAVFGVRRGSFAEYVCGTERNFAPAPKGLTFEQAAAVPIAAMTALQALRDKGRVRPGQKVLITGASGGVGTFAVQIAKALGANVTAICSTRSVDMLRSIGADHVLDYSKDDFTRSSQRYDLVVDVAGNRSVFAVRRILAPGGTLVLVGAPKGRWLAPLSRMLESLLLSRLVRQRIVAFISKYSKADLLVLKELVEAGKVRPIIDRTYSLSQAAAAIRHLESEHVSGKVVITV